MTFDDFARQVRALLEPAAAEKGYNATGADGENELFAFVQRMAGDRHALGEIIYKVTRYAAKGHPDDLLKIAAWAFLILKHRPRP